MSCIVQDTKYCTAIVQKRNKKADKLGTDPTNMSNVKLDIQYCTVPLYFSEQSEHVTGAKRVE